MKSPALFFASAQNWSCVAINMRRGTTAMPSVHKRTLKEQAVAELRNFWMIFLYLAVLFSAFNTYGG